MIDFEALTVNGSLTGLYLDDCRPIPPDNHFLRWQVVRSYDEFIAHIQTHGLPGFISFDHDLGELALKVGASSNWHTFDYEACAGEMTGYDCAKWLVTHCLENGHRMPPFSVHSANPPGAANILGLLNNLRKHQGQPADGYRTAW